jgi:monoamine oxidase
MTPQTTRRTFLGGAAAAGAALALPGGALARSSRTRRKVQVAVVGAGLAGLTAARELAADGKSVCLIEASDVVGGRTRNEQVSKGVISEVGGQYIGPTQDRIAALAKSLRIKTFKTYNDGSNVQFLHGQRSLYPATGLPDDPEAADAIIKLLGLDALAAEVSVDTPWKAKRAAEWDKMTFGDYIDANVSSPTGRKVAALAGEAIWGCEPEEQSMLYTLFYIAAAGNEKEKGSIVRLVTTGGGAQDERFVGGSQKISLEVARKLGSRVVLDSPVTEIESIKGGMRVTSRKIVVDAERVVVAVPPAVVSKIRFSPGLPSGKRAILKGLVPGKLIKWEAVYDKPFWREAGLSGQVVSDVGPANTTFDNSPPDGSPGIMFGFLGGAEGKRAAKLSKSARRKAVLDNFVTYFGDEAADPVKAFEKDWTDEPWIRGCPVGHTGTNVFRKNGPALRVPSGRVHFAGTETSTYWFGYMDGAVRSGERAAEEVSRALK